MTVSCTVICGCWSVHELTSICVLAFSVQSTDQVRSWTYRGMSSERMHELIAGNRAKLVLLRSRLLDKL